MKKALLLLTTIVVLMTVQSNSYAQVIANAGPDTTICLGMAVQIGGSPTAWGGSPPYTYAWSPATGLSAVSDPNPFASPATTTTYTVTVHDNGGLTNTDVMTVTVNPNPSITVVPAYSTICPGSCITLTASGAIIYSWNNGLMGPNPTVCPATSTHYTVTGTDMNGCTGTSTAVVIVDSGLVLTVATTNASCLTCADGSATVNVSTGLPPFFYQWSNLVNAQSNPGLLPGTYYVTVTDADGCISVDTAIIGVGNCVANFYLIPDSLVPHLYYAVNLSSGVPPLHYLWSWGDGATDTIAYPSHTYASAGYYNICVSITDSIGCSSTFCDSSHIQKSGNALVTVIVIDPSTVSVQETENNLTLTLFPNPFSNSGTLLLSSPVQNATLTVYDIVGKEIKRITNLNGKEIIIQREKMKAGIYFFRIENKSVVVGNGKMVVE